MFDTPEKAGPETTTSTYRLSLKGKGISVEEDVDRATALQVVTLLMGGAAPMPNPHAGASGTAGGSHGPGNPAPSPREKLDAAKANRWPDKIAVMGAHIQDSGQATFTREAVKTQLAAAGEGKPGNYTRDFNWTVKNGWIAPTPGSTKDFYITQKGRGAIAQEFSQEVKKATAQMKGARRRKKAAEAKPASA
jgi:hypothetical protein